MLWDNRANGRRRSPRQPEDNLFAGMLRAMPERTAAFPEATRARVHTVADALARERGGAERVTEADLREHLADTHGRLGRFFAGWLAARTGGVPPEAQHVPSKPAPANPVSADRPRPPVARGRPRKAGPKRPQGSMVATAGQEVADERRSRLTKRFGEAYVAGADQRAKAADRAANAPDLSTASGRLRAAVDGIARPGAPKRRRVVRADYQGAANEGVAAAVATFLCDRGRPARSREIFARFHPPTTYPLSEKAAHALVVAALKGSRIVMTGGEWWFEGEEKPRKVVGDSFEQLFLEAAKQTLREAAGREMSAPEIEAAHGDAHLTVGKGRLGDALRREAARFEAARSGPDGKETGKKKGTAAVAAVPEDGGIEKVGEAYRWAVQGTPRRR
jgi:hypothetical protein